jgi:hypothetical protein
MYYALTEANWMEKEKKIGETIPDGPDVRCACADLHMYRGCAKHENAWRKVVIFVRNDEKTNGNEYS